MQFSATGMNVETKLFRPPSLVRFLTCSALPKKKACSLDGVSARLLKEADTIIAPFLTNLFNLSISSRIFPRDWKLAKVTLIYKDDKKCIPDNYRPISALPAITKLIEFFFLLMNFTVI